MSKDYTATISYINQIAPNTFEARFALTDSFFKFSPGQYVWVELPHLLFEDPRGSRRAFSISSSPHSTGSIEILFRGSESGFKKTLTDKRSRDMTVNIIGPFGFMGLPESQDAQLVFMAGGVGVAPFLSMIRYATEKQLRHNILLICSHPNKDASFYSDVFLDFEKIHPYFTFIEINSRLGCDDLKKHVSEVKKSMFYVVGPKGYVIDTTDKLLALGAMKEHFVFDEYYGFDNKLRNTVLDTYTSDQDITLQDFRTAVTDVAEHIIITDQDGFIRYANPAAEKITMYSFREMKGSTPRLWGGLMDKAFYQNMWKTIKDDKEAFSGEIKNRRKNGEEYYAITKISPIMNNGDLIGYVGTEQDITVFKELDKMKDEFVATASHELRTPIAAIDGLVSMILSGEYGAVNNNLLPPLGDINTSCDRLIRLVNDLLNMSRIQSGRLKYTMSEFILSTVIREAVSLLQPLVKNKKVVVSAGNMSDISVCADLDKVKQVLNNIIGNALKFTDSGHVDISMKHDADRVMVIVADTGIGISEKDQKKLFGKFQQLESGSEKPYGTGLGLYLSLKMIKKMGGDLWLESSHKGKGSVFIFSLLKAGATNTKQLIHELDLEAQVHHEK